MSNQHGYIRLGANGKAFHIRYYAWENGKRKQRSHRLCAKDELHPSKEAPAVIALAEDFIAKINVANAANDDRAGHNCPLCGNRCKRTITQKFAPKV